MAYQICPAFNSSANGICTSSIGEWYSTNAKWLYFTVVC